MIEIKTTLAFITLVAVGAYMFDLQEKKFEKNISIVNKRVGLLEDVLSTFHDGLKLETMNRQEAVEQLKRHTRYDATQPNEAT